MRTILLLSLVLSASALGIACGSKNSCGGSDTPTAAYKRLYEAVKAKNTENIKNEMSKTTQDFAIMVAQRQNSPAEKVFENGFTATTFAETLPEIRDERIAGCSGAVEVRNSKDNVWEDLPYVNENGNWKLAVGELFGGSFTSPGKGRAAKEKEAANLMGNGAAQANLATDNNSNSVANANFNGTQVEPLANGK